MNEERSSEIKLIALYYYDTNNHVHKSYDERIHLNGILKVIKTLISNVIGKNVTILIISRSMETK